MKTTVGELKQLVQSIVTEARGRLTPQEVLTTYEDLYISNHGTVPVDQLASFVGADNDQVFQAAMKRAGLLVDKRGNVVERGNTPASM